MYNSFMTVNQLILPAALSVFSLNAQTPQGPNDSFTSNKLDLGKWDLFLNGGATASTGAGLQMSLNGSNSFSSARSFTFYRFTGDFDVPVDFNLGAGWTSSFPGSDTSPQLNGGGLMVYLDDPNWMIIFRSRFNNFEGFTFYSNVDIGSAPRSQSIPSTATSGSLRRGTSTSC